MLHLLSVLAFKINWGSQLSVVGAVDNAVNLMMTGNLHYDIFSSFYDVIALA